MPRKRLLSMFFKRGSRLPRERVGAIRPPFPFASISSLQGFLRELVLSHRASLLFSEEYNMIVSFFFLPVAHRIYNDGFHA